MEIREMKDISEMLELHKKIFGQEFLVEGYLKKKKKYTIQKYFLEISKQNVGYFILVDQQEEKNIYIWYLGILPEYQGKGLGSKVINKAIEIASKKRYKTVTVATTNLRPNMIKLLLKNRFDIYDLKKRKENEGNKIYFKYEILPARKIKLDISNMSLVDIERKLIREIKNNVIEINVKNIQNDSEKREYIKSYCENFYPKIKITFEK